MVIDSHCYIGSTVDLPARISKTAVGEGYDPMPSWIWPTNHPTSVRLETFLTSPIQDTGRPTPAHHLAVAKGP